ncbi:MAG: helix-turn-helix domain-containing protein [Gammaproteobacteria bacterium]|nr:helix-turn-helix domain-containing protein [Gammaproteobacteria bacterium]
MSDDVRVSAMPADSETPADTDASIGGVLREAREALDLTEEAAASSLHLDPAILRALEQDDFARLGAPVFVRGHLRKYAGLLKLDADTLLARYQAIASTEMPLPARSAKRPDRFAVDDGLNWPVVLAVLAVVLLAAFAVWRLRGQPAEPMPVATDLSQAFSAGVQSRLAEIDPTLPPAPVSLPRGTSSAALAAVPPARETLAASPPDESLDAPVAATLAAGEGLHLVIGFTEECWTEIIDADGRRLYFGLAAADQRVDVRGRAPVSLLLGNAAAARVWIDGEPWNVPRERIVNNVARVRLEPSP